MSVYYLIERNDRGYAEWAMPGRGYAATEWTTDVSKAQHYDWHVPANRDARGISKVTGLLLRVTEHMDMTHG